MSDSQSKAGDWIAENLSLNTIITVMILVIGWIANWATQRATINEHERRITALEIRFDKEVVPRTEQSSKDTQLDRRLSNIENMLRDLTSRDYSLPRNK